MEHIIAAQSEPEFRHYHSLSLEMIPHLMPFLEFLTKEYSVTKFPNAILWTSSDIASHTLSSIPLPAYTDEFRVVFCPDIHVWRNLYLKQFQAGTLSGTERYYQTCLSQNHILQILGHEFVHHSELFIDDAYESSAWFEEGMCEYISRKFFLTDTEFRESIRINRVLAEHYRKNNSGSPPCAFSVDTYQGSIAAIFHEYWRSFLAVWKIVDDFHGNIPAVFHSYHEWYKTDRTQPLSEWFHISL